MIKNSFLLEKRVL